MEQNLKQKATVYWIIWGALFYSHLMYGAVIFFKPSVTVKPSPYNLIFFALSGLALLAALLLYKKARQLKRSTIQALSKNSPQTFSKTAFKFTLFSIISWVLSEVPSIIGLVYHYSNPSSQQSISLLLLALGITVHLINRPLLPIKQP